MNSSTNSAQIRLSRTSATYWRVTLDNPPLNLMGAAFVLQFREIVAAIESDERVKVVVFESRGRALEVLLGSDDIRGDMAEFFGYVNRSLPDAELDQFVAALATRIASFDKWAIANTKRPGNEASLPPDVEIAAGWDACMTSLTRPAAKAKIKALFEQGFHKPGDTENRLGFYLGQLER